MDAETLAAYEADAARHAAFQRSVAPNPVHRLAAAFFHPGEPTADVGCGGGRDTAWLAGQGFPTVVAERGPLGVARGPERVQAVLAQDRQRSAEERRAVTATLSGKSL